MPKLLSHSHILSQAGVYRLLGRQTADDAFRNGWLKPCCLKVVPHHPQRRHFDLEAIRRVEGRLLAGEYPGQTKQ